MYICNVIYGYYTLEKWIYVFLIIYVSSCFFNSFELFVTVQRWIGHGCTLQKGQTPIFVESLTNSFKLLRTMQEMRRHSWCIAHAMTARIWEYSVTQLQSDCMWLWEVLSRTTRSGRNMARRMLHLRRIIHLLKSYKTRILTDWFILISWRRRWWRCRRQWWWCWWWWWWYWWIPWWWRRLSHGWW